MSQRRERKLSGGIVAITAFVGCAPAEPADSVPDAPGVVEQAWEVLPVRLLAERERHTATLLADGTVLFAGGARAGAALSSAEIYVPTTGEVRSVGDMAVARVGHAATLLRDGTVLLTGGEGADARAAELFVPGAGVFEPAGTLQAAVRSAHTASLLRDARQGASGHVLIAGGCAHALPNAWSACTAALSTAELYDPHARTFRPLPDMSSHRAQHRATVLPEGDVLLSGGSSSAASAERFDAGAMRFVDAPAPEVHMAHTATLLHQRKVLLTGDFHDKDGRIAQLWNPEDGVFELVGSLGTARSWHTATLIATDRVLLTGGLTEHQEPYPPKADVEEFDPVTATFVARPPLVAARSFHTATHLPSGAVLVAGGRDAAGGQHGTLEVLPPASGAFSAHADASFSGTDAASVVLADGRVLLTGGRRPSPSSEAWVFDGRTGGELVPTGALHVPRAGHAMVLLDSGDVLVVGGTDVPARAEVFEPATGAFRPVAALPALPRPTLTRLPTGKVLVVGGPRAALYEPEHDTFTALDAAAPGAEGHTATLLPDGDVLVVGGEPEPTGAWRYRAAAGTFERLVSDLGPRTFHTATLLPSGRVLVRGGVGFGGPRPDADLVDPATGATERLGGLVKRARHTATLLPTGEVLFIGGDRDGSAEVFDPATRRVRAASVSEGVRDGSTAALLRDGSVLVAGGPAEAPIERWRENPSAPEAYRATAAWGAPVSSLEPGAEVQLMGSLFTCFTEANGGAPTESATNHPVAIWRPREGVPSSGGVVRFSPGEVVWRVPASAFPGPGELFVIVNGLASTGLYAVLHPAKDGHPCDVGSECASGQCVEGVCCEGPCANECTTCATGRCLPSPRGAPDPRRRCGAIDCTLVTCDGAGACEVEPDGTECSAGSMARCRAGVCTTGPCQSSRECPAGEVCTAAGLCAAPLAPLAETSCAARSAPRRGDALAVLFAVLALGAQRSRLTLRVGWKKRGQA